MIGPRFQVRFQPRWFSSGRRWCVTPDVTSRVIVALTAAIWMLCCSGFYSLLERSVLLAVSYTHVYIHTDVHTCSTSIIFPFDLFPCVIVYHQLPSGFVFQRNSLVCIYFQTPVLSAEKLFFVLYFCDWDNLLSYWLTFLDLYFLLSMEDDWRYIYCFLLKIL